MGVKAIIDFDHQIDEYLVDINGEPYECLPYLDPSFSLEDTEIKTISGWIMVNDKIVHEGGAEWQPYVLQHSIFAKIHDEEPINKIEIHTIKEAQV